MRTILLVALLVLPGAALADEPLATAAESVAIGDRLAESDTPLDLKASILCYERALETDRETKTAVEKIARAKQRLHVLAGPARERANAFLLAGDDIEAERYLCEAISIDPFDRALRVSLAGVRVRLRREAVQFQLDELRRVSPKLRLRLVGPDSLGVPPGYERMTNDPRFASPPRDSHSG